MDQWLERSKVMNHGSRTLTPAKVKVILKKSVKGGPPSRRSPERQSPSRGSPKGRPRRDQAQTPGSQGHEPLQKGQAAQPMAPSGEDRRPSPRGRALLCLTREA